MTAHGRVSEEDEVTDLTLPTDKWRALDVAVHRALWPEKEVCRHGQDWVYAETIDPGSDYPAEGLPLYSSDWKRVPILLDRVRELGWTGEVSDALERLAGDVSGHTYKNVVEAIDGLLFYGVPFPEQLCRAIVAASEEERTR